MTLTTSRERMLRGQAAAADQQPWRCDDCGEAVSHINPRPCRCVREAMAEHPPHVHTPASPRPQGTYVDVCECGATRDVRNGMSAWHTCHLCTHPWGL